MVIYPFKLEKSLFLEYILIMISISTNTTIYILIFD